jgi:hypothetical protein
MKKANNPIAQSHAKFVEMIRTDERAKVTALYSKRQTKIYDLASEILGLSAALDGDDPVLPDRSPTPKRKAVAASEAEIADAYEVLCETKPAYSALSPKNLAAMWRSDKSAYRLAGAALKALVAQGKATVKRGKYAQVEAPQEQPSDGATDGAR